MRRKRLLGVLVAFALAGAFAAMRSGGGPPAASGGDVAVVRIVDGDTLVVTGGVRVRLIGINTPESVDPRRPVECFGKEAAAALGRLVPPGTAVRLTYDVERTDDFGRTLAYLYRQPDGLFVNATLVEQGYAHPATYPPNVAHAGEFAALARQARQGNAGLWSACSGGTSQ
jgi:micrococcal nuclease